MTSTYAIRTADLTAAPAAAQVSSARSFVAAQGTAMSAFGGRGRCYAATLRTGLVVATVPAVDTVPTVPSVDTNERHVAVIGTSPVVSPVVFGSGFVGSVVEDKDVVPALRTWRPPV